MPQATARWLVQLKTVSGPRMESAKCEASSDAMVVAHSSHRLRESSTPASYCALVLLGAKTRSQKQDAGIKITQERRWRREGGAGDKHPRGKPVKRKKRENRDSFLGKSVEYSRQPAKRHQPGPSYYFLPKAGLYLTAFYENQRYFTLLPWKEKKINY